MVKRRKWGTSSCENIPFDSNAKRHTSFVSVYVYPLVEDDIQIEINQSDYSWETMRASGAGGKM